MLPKVMVCNKKICSMCLKIGWKGKAKECSVTNQFCTSPQSGTRVTRGENRHVLEYSSKLWNGSLVQGSIPGPGQIFKVNSLNWLLWQPPKSDRHTSMLGERQGFQFRLGVRGVEAYWILSAPEHALSPIDARTRSCGLTLYVRERS